MDIDTAIKIHTPNEENIFPKLRLAKICCHKILSFMDKLSNHFEKIPRDAPRIKIILEFSIFLKFVKLDLGVLMLSKKLTIKYLTFLCKFIFLKLVLNIITYIFLNIYFKN